MFWFTAIKFQWVCFPRVNRPEEHIWLNGSTCKVNLKNSYLYLEVKEV